MDRQSQNFQDLQVIQQCLGTITGKLLKLKGTAPSSYQVKKAINNAISQVDDLEWFAQKAFTRHEAKKQSNDQVQRQRQQQGQPQGNNYQDQPQYERQERYEGQTS